MIDTIPGCMFLSHAQARDSGDYLHRVILPGEALSRHLPTREIQTGHPEFVRLSLQADLLVIVMVADAVTKAIVQERRRRGLPTVYEISDDFEDFSPELPLHSFYRQPEVRNLIASLAGEADLLQFSSHGLQAKYGHLNPRQVVFMNQLHGAPVVRDRPPGQAEAPVLGWAGSLGHLADAQRLAALLKAWLRQRRTTDARQPSLSIMADEQACTVFESAGLNIRRQPTGAFADYLRFLSQIDIGFAVIDDSDFAKGRSDGKFIEYASQGVVCIASRLGEYAHSIRHGETGYLFSDSGSFFSALDLAYGNPAERVRVAGAARQYVCRERTHEAAALHRLQVYRPLLARSAKADAAASETLKGRLLSLVSDSEGLMLKATALHTQGRLQEALAIYLGVLELHPGFHLPWQRAALIARRLGADRDADQFESVACRCLAGQLPQATVAARML